MYKPFLLSLFALALAATACGSSEKKGNGGNGNGGSGATGTLLTAGNGSGAGGNTKYVGGTQNLTPTQADALRNSSCAGWSESTEAQPSVLDMVVDTSLSMDETAPGGNQSKWVVTQAALVKAVAALPDSTGLGLLLFPNMGTAGTSTAPRPITACVNVAAMIPVDSLTVNRTKIDNALNQSGPNGSTPTHDAYRYALVNGLVPSKLPGDRFMLLITDGQPTYSLNCEGTGLPADPVNEQPIVDEIQGAFGMGIRTFVIGSPGSDRNQTTGEDTRPWLSRAARAGGTAKPNCSDTGPTYCHMDMTQEPDFSAALNAGLAQIAGQIVSCSYPMPTPPAGKQVDANAINVLYTNSNGQDVLVLRSDAANCTDGWHYDGTNIVLCSNTCSAVKTGNLSSLEVLGGCLSITGPLH